jgi:hypothetical protein
MQLIFTAKSYDVLSVVVFFFEGIFQQTFLVREIIVSGEKKSD